MDGQSQKITLLGSNVKIRNLPIKQVSLLEEGSLPAYGYNPGDHIELMAGDVSIEYGRPWSVRDTYPDRRIDLSLDLDLVRAVVRAVVPVRASRLARLRAAVPAVWCKSVRQTRRATRRSTAIREEV